MNHILRISGIIGILHCTSVFPTPLSTAAIAQPAQSHAAHELFACRAIDDDSARLVCLDREMEALLDAVESDEVLIVKQEEIRKAQSDLFGLALPKINLFSRRTGNVADVGEEEIKEIQDTLSSFAVDSSGHVFFVLSNGARWTQTDNIPVLGEPKEGEIVRIESAAVGSFKATIGDRRAIRVRRVN